MDSFELNKIIAAILMVALLVIRWKGRFRRLRLNSTRSEAKASADYRRDQVLIQLMVRFKF